jgi:tetratricopeptide (TPR) repeat protein
VDRGVIATARELLEARHFPGVVAMCSDALDDEPECVPLLLVRAQARIALRRDLDAQADLRDVIRIDPGCSLAYRLLGELAARRDENASAAAFFREALRLDPDDREANDWLMIVEPASRPAAAAHQLPATAAAAGHFSSRRASSPSQVRLARGTQPPDQIDGDERPTRPFGRVEPPASSPPRGVSTPASSRRASEPRAASPAASAPAARPTLPGRPPTQPPGRPAPRPASRGAPELPGFGEYLVATGILTRERLRAAQAYQRSMKVQMSTAIVTLGLASPQRIEWAAVAHQSQLPRG